MPIPTISTEQLSKELSTVKVLDCSVKMGRPAGECPILGFNKQHIPGAQYLDLDNLRNHMSNLPFMLPSEKMF